MKTGWAVVVSGWLFACLRPPSPVAPAEPAAPPAPDAPSALPTAAPAAKALPLDDSTSCFDRPSDEELARNAANHAEREPLESEVERRIEEQWPLLRACPGVSATTAPVHLKIDVGADGATAARVLTTWLADCAGVDCIRQRLSGLQVAPPRANRFLTFNRWIELDPAASPRSQRGPGRSRPRGDGNQLAGCLSQDTDRSGYLAPEVIRNTVRASYGEFRRCYTQGLARHPTLRGRITVRFVIGRDGRVRDATVVDNDLEDCGVTRCARDVFLGLSFPPPELGVVNVVYPIVLEPERPGSTASR